jgi:hypothetical protein
MASIADHTAREIPSTEESSAVNLRAAADRIALKCRPAPSLRAPPTTMPYAVCLRLAGAWIGALGALLAIVLTIRWII